MAGVTRKLCNQLQRVAPVMPRAKTTGGFGAWECVWWLSVHSYAGEAPCSQALPPAFTIALGRDSLNSVVIGLRPTYCVGQNESAPLSRCLRVDSSVVVNDCMNSRLGCTERAFQGL